MLSEEVASTVFSPTFKKVGTGTCAFTLMGLRLALIFTTQSISASIVPLTEPGFETTLGATFVTGLAEELTGAGTFATCAFVI